MNTLRWLLLALLVLSTAPIPAQLGSLSDNPESRLRTVPHDPQLEAALRDANLGQLIIMTDGTRETFPVYARIRLHELTGRTSIGRQLPEYSILSIIHDRDRWFDARIFPVEHPRIDEILNIRDKWVSAKFVMENPELDAFRQELMVGFETRDAYEKQRNLVASARQVRELGGGGMAIAAAITPMVSREALLPLLDDAAYAGARAEMVRLKAAWAEAKPFADAGGRLIQRINLLGEKADQFFFIPDQESLRSEWITATTAASRAGARDPIFAAGLELDGGLRTAFRQRDAASIGAIAPSVNSFLAIANGNPLYPSELHRSVSNTYLRLNPFRTAAWVYLVSAVVYGLFFFFQSPVFRRVATGIFAAGFLLQTGAVVMRLYLSGHVPVSNLYESVTFASWAAMAIAAVFEAVKRNGLVGTAAAVIGFLSLSASALFPMHDTRIHPLRAVLNSYWLNIHVTMMLISYAAFMLSAFFATGHLLKSFFSKDPAKGLMSTEQLEEFAYRLVQVGWPVITVGITLGAVWADTAWGRYWGWDPKETWAFITWLIYTIYLHTRMILGWRGRLSALACLLGFISVLFTWIGVSYLPWFADGLHTYASPT